MKILVTGSRKFTDIDIIRDSLADTLLLSAVRENSVAHGAAKGADSLTEEVCNNWKLPVRRYPANWDKYGKAAGPIRNAQMLTDFQPDIVLAFYKVGEPNTGTLDCVKKALEQGIPVKIYPEK